MPASGKSLDALVLGHVGRLKKSCCVVSVLQAVRLPRWAGDSQLLQRLPPSVSSGARDQLVLTLPSCNFGNRNAFPGKHLGCSRIWLKNKYAASSFLSSGCEKFLEFIEWYLISWDERMGRLFGGYLLPLLSYLLSQLMRLSWDRWRPEWLTNLDFTGFPGVWFFFWLSMKEEGDI